MKRKWGAIPRELPGESMPLMWITSNRKHSVLLPVGNGVKGYLRLSPF